jgi:hypothetical protein
MEYGASPYPLASRGCVLALCLPCLFALGIFSEAEQLFSFIEIANGAVVYPYNIRSISLSLCIGPCFGPLMKKALLSDYETAVWWITHSCLVGATAKRCGYGSAAIWLAWPDGIA